MAAKATRERPECPTAGVTEGTDDEVAKQDDSMAASTKRHKTECLPAGAKHKVTDNDDRGHRFGNFRTYYNFNSVANRTILLGAMLEYIGTQWKGERPMCYLDIGCNEGDLTLEVAKTLAERLESSLHFTGIDIDPVLIERSRKKLPVYCRAHDLDIQGDFRIADVLSEGIPIKSDFTTLLSTTMWLHIHGGDDGLRRILQQICQSTSKWIVVEPQPSKCYANAANRLRRMELPSLDVSNERLSLRHNVESVIERIILENNFERCQVNQMSTANSKTSWKRVIRLYQRKRPVPEK